MPVRFGQEIKIQQSKDKDQLLRWKALVQGNEWFDASYDMSSLEIIETNDIEKAKFLRKILMEAVNLNPEALTINTGISVETQANFDINWGLGSSSTLIANVAKWFRIDPFLLHFNTSGGSGYDIACADATGPLFYTRKGNFPHVEPANFNPDFQDKLYFVYLGEKQRSDVSIENLKHRLENRDDDIESVSEISGELISTHDLEEFEFFICKLEQIMSGVLGIPTIKQSRFQDFSGTVKSLGAWGGDFVMMTWKDGLESLKSYLNPKGLDIVFTFADLKLPDSTGETNFQNRHG